MMVTEFMSGGTLCVFIRILMFGCILTHVFISSSHVICKNNFVLLERLRARIIVDVVRGMLYLHSRSPPVLHRDLNTKNLLLDDHWMTKLSDFGLSRVKDELDKMTGNVGFLANIAPEVFKGEKYSEKADVFSFGMILYELFTGREPQEGMDILKYANEVAHSGFRPPFPGESRAAQVAVAKNSGASDSSNRPPFNTLVIHPEWKQLIQDCWDQNPEKRPSFAQILTRINTMMQNKVPSTTKPPTAAGAASTAAISAASSTAAGTTPAAAKAPAPQLNSSGYIT